MQSFSECRSGSQAKSDGPLFSPPSRQSAVTVVPIQVEQQCGYKSEPFSVTPDRHFVGQDGFMVPKDFDEFYRRYPTTVRRWLMRKPRKRAVDDCVLELEQELLVYLCCLPQKSKLRLKGATSPPSPDPFSC